MIRRLVEAGVVGAGGALVGSAAGSLIGLGVPATVVAGANGVVSGWRGVYDWRCSTGVIAALLDSSWALLTTAGSLGSHAIALVTCSDYAASMSERRNRHVYSGGFTPRRGFAVTVGNVISGAGDTTVESRRRLVDDHEDVHVWQARILGPIFPLAYVGWLALGGVLGTVGWLRARLGGDRSSTLWASIDRCAYWNNPFERQAYLRASRANRATRG